MRRISRLTYPLLALSLMVGLLLVPGTAAHATFPGANGRIVFDDFVTGQTYTVNPDGTDLVQLTHVARGQFAGDPSWSPDSTHIAYESTHGGVIRLWIMDADGRHQHMVADDLPNAADVGPAYTPDGTRLVYHRCLGRACAIYSIGVDGTHRRALTPFVRPPFEVFDVYPSVAPDGTIAFSRFNQNVEGIISQVYVMGADGSNPHPMTAPRLEAWDAGWSPDSERISFSSNCCRRGTNGYVMNRDGTHIRKLTSARFPYDDFEVAYSPDGNRMVFGSTRRYSDLCCTDLFVMKANGTQQTFIDTGLLGVEDFDWGSAPPIAADSVPAFTAPAVSRAEAAARLPARCRMLPRPLRVMLPCP
jgi:Tol biopolymer transport system component